MRRRVQVLVVDDSSMMRQLMKRAITLSGGDVAAIHEAGNGQEALAVMERHDVDVVFTDINMPVMTGTDLLRAMTERGWDHIIRVVVSSDGSTARREEVEHLDVRMYVEKPFAPEVIRDVLSQVG